MPVARLQYEKNEKISGEQARLPMAIVTRRRVNLCVKGTIWLVCVTGFLFQASRVVELYEKYEFTVTVFEEMRSNIEFPAVTICTEQW